MKGEDCRQGIPSRSQPDEDHVAGQRYRNRSLGLLVEGEVSESPLLYVLSNLVDGGSIGPSSRQDVPDGSLDGADVKTRRLLKLEAHRFVELHYVLPLHALHPLQVVRDALSPKFSDFRASFGPSLGVVGTHGNLP